MSFHICCRVPEWFIILLYKSSYSGISSVLHPVKPRSSSLVRIVVLALYVFCMYSPAWSAWYDSGNGGAVAGGVTTRSVDAGLAMLQKDGTAADAAAATLLALTVEDYGMFCLGGEVPFIYYNAENGEVKVLSGQGRAPLDTNAIEWLLDNGIPTTSSSDNIKSAAVPAVIDLCVTAMKLWGTLSFEEVVQPTLDILDRGGESWYDECAVTLRKLVEAEQNMSGTYQEKLQEVSDRFYRGDIADDLDSWYRSNGGFLRKRDLEAHVTNIEDPISINYKGYTVYKCDTWTQGAVLLQALRLLEGYDLQQMGHMSADYIHVVTEALKLALADRDEYYADPAFEDVPLEALLSDEYTELRRTVISMERASDSILSGDPVNMLARNPDPHPQLKWPRGTTTCSVVDKWGNVVACTPSGWGSHAGVGSTGVPHGTRLISLNTWDDHPNRIAPGKRPCITLTPTLVTKDNKPILAISVAMGDEQDQTALNLLLDFIEFGIEPREAVELPRFSTDHRTGFFSQPRPSLASLKINSDVSSSIRNELANRGHNISTTSGAVAYPVMIYIDHDEKMYYVAGDPRCSRKVGAYDIPTQSEPYLRLLKARKITVLPQHNGVVINYYLVTPDNTTLTVYNALGHAVISFPLSKETGAHTIIWHGEDRAGHSVASGCYVAIMRQGDTRICEKFLVTSSF